MRGLYVSDDGNDKSNDRNDRNDRSILSPREQQVLKLVAQGSTNNQIASKLHLSPRTVEKHRAKLMEKLNLSNRTDLIRYAISRGLISPEHND
jgi:DNA-binding NarL/FixJ family response regulator